MERNIKLVNTSYSDNLISENESIIDQSMNYMNKKRLNKEILVPTNYVQIYKKIYLLCKLVRMKGDCKTKEFSKIYEKSCIQ